MENENVDYKKAGEQLRNLRKKTGLSIFKVAKGSFISGNYLSLLERGKQMPSDAVIYNLADFYQIDPNEIFAMYNKIEPEQIKEILSIPSLKKIVTDISRDKTLTREEKEQISIRLAKMLDTLKLDKEVN